MVTRKPRDSRMAASEAAAIPLPRADTTPPVTNTYLVMSGLARNGRAAAGSLNGSRNGANSRNLHRLGAALKPRLGSAFEQGRQSFAHFLMVGIKPGDLCVGEHVEFHTTCIDRTQGKGFKAQKVTELGALVSSRQHEVFNTDAPASRTIQPRLVGGGHRSE